MKNLAHVPRRWGTIRERISPSLIFLISALLAALFLGAVISAFGVVYSAVVAGTFVIVIIFLLRQDELIVMLIVATHILVDSYLGFDVYQIALLMALAFLLACYLGRSADHPWTWPRSTRLWVLFLILNIYPTINGGAYRLTNAIAFYLNLVLSAFIMFWLGNIIAKDISAVRRVFQLLSVLATLIAIHTIIEAITGVFLFESAEAEATLAQYSNFQLQGVADAYRFGSFLGNPNGNGIFLATSFFLPLGLFIESKRLWAKLIYLLETLLILLAVMFTYSTGSWAAVLIGVVVLTFTVGRIRYTALLLTSMLTLAAVTFTIFPSQIDQGLVHANNQNHILDHLGAWQTASRVIEAYPLFGVGLGDIYIIRAEPFRVPAQTAPQAEPDNTYLEWGAEGGIPVMLVFLLLLSYVFRFSWRNWLTIGARYRSLLGGGIVALIALSINSLVVDGWTYSGGTAYFGWLIAGIVASPLIGRHLHYQSASSTDVRGGQIAPSQAEISRRNIARRGSWYE